jgi:branched-chain amino acid transport system permease protein
LYATVAVGVTLVFGIMGVLNFAHGQMVMLGAYTAFFVVTARLGFWPALLVGIVCNGAARLDPGARGFRYTLADHMQGLTASLALDHGDRKPCGSSVHA